MRSAGFRLPASRRKAWTSGFWPLRQRSLKRTAGSSPATGASGVRLASVIAYLVESKFLGDAFDGAGELLAPSFRGAAHLSGALGPPAPLPAQVRDLALLLVETLADFLQDLALSPPVAGAGPRGDGLQFLLPRLVHQAVVA